MIETISNKDLFNLLEKEGFPNHSISLADEYFAIPTEKDIKKFGNRVYNFLSFNGLSHWQEEIWDCDDFSLAAKFLCSVDNVKHKKQTGSDFAIGFGMAWVVEKEEGGHAINLAVLKSNGIFVIKYFEPQIQEICLKEIPKESFSQLLWCYF